MCRKNKLSNVCVGIINFNNNNQNAHVFIVQPRIMNMKLEHLKEMITPSKLISTT